MSNDTTLKRLLAVFIVIILALALTPSIASTVEDAKYAEITEYDEMTPSSSNSTTTAQTARNDSATYGYFTISLNATDAYGLTDIEEATNITYTVSTKTLTFKEGVLNKTVIYNVTIVYFYIASTVAESLLDIVPVIYVTMVLAVGTATILVVLKKRGG